MFSTFVTATIKVPLVHGAHSLVTVLQLKVLSSQWVLASIKPRQRKNEDPLIAPQEVKDSTGYLFNKNKKNLNQINFEGAFKFDCLVFQLL